MKKRILLLIPLLSPLVMSCSNNNNNSEYDPFMIGDNLEVISDGEASLIANEAYDNLRNIATLRQSSTVSEDDTKFYTGAFSNYATNTKTTTDAEVTIYANKIDLNRNVTTTTYIGNDSTVENRNTVTTEWYGIKPVGEGEVESENYSLLRKTVDKYNGVSSTRYSATDNFSTKENVSAIWNRYIVTSIGDAFLTISIAYSPDYTYVRDGQHVLGYYMSSVATTENSKIAPGKEDVSYVRKDDVLTVIDFYKDEVLGIDWTVRTVSSRVISSYLTTADGQETDPIEVARREDVVSFVYEANKLPSEDIPEYVLTETIPFSISKFVYNSTHDGIVYDSHYELENNDDYYRHFENDFSGHAYYKEQKLEVGYYSFFDGNESVENKEKWGYADIIANKCVNYIIDPTTLPESEQAIIAGHTKLFYVAAEATFAFRVVFDADMNTASEFSVAIVGR